MNSTSGREFVDTNILVYALDVQSGPKREVSMDLIARLWQDRNGCVSIQVLQELYVTLTSKAKLPATDAAAFVQRFGKWKVYRPSVDDIVMAARMNQEKKISFWDAMIVRSAVASGCAVLWTEDLNHGQRWETVQVRNPFLGI